MEMTTEKGLHRQTFKRFSRQDDKTWEILFNNLDTCRREMAWSGFVQGLDDLAMDWAQIPDLDRINQVLNKRTGWRGVPVTGLEDGYSFYPALARREFPIGNFIRDQDSLGYTPEPDIFHDLYGHIPFYMDTAYGDYCWRYGKVASKYLDNPEKLQMYERFFWFCVEFPLVETPAGRRIFGAGILSSRDESRYSLSNEPQVLPFNIETICKEDFRIDQIQPRLFVLKSPEQLYGSLGELEVTINRLAT